MKLYTEEQLQEAYNRGHMDGELNNTDYSITDGFTPIELPSDEDRINKFNAFISTEVALKFLTKEQGERLKWYHETYLNR